jgi:hypothetical protein
MPLGPETTTFTRDVLGRFICSTWEEATADPDGIDVVVLGGGLYGGYCASKIYQLSRAALDDGNSETRDALRVLVLDAGPFVLPEHTANIPDLGFFDPAGDGPVFVGTGSNPPICKRCGASAGAANSRLSGRPIASAARGCTGVAGAHGFSRSTSPNGRPTWPTI